MFWDKTKPRLSALALAAAVLALPAAAMAGVVVKATGPSAAKYPIGTKLSDDASVTLKAGDVITVLTGNGTRVIKGAGTFRVGDRPQVASDRFAMLTRKRAATRVRTGAVRGESEEPVTNPSLWYVDVTRPGTICLYDLAAVRLWRPGNQGTSTYRIAADGGTAQADVTFDDTVTVAALDPARLPVTEGRAYIITGPDGSTSARVNFVLLGEDYPEGEGLAEALIARGCSVQVEQLATTLAAAAEASGG